MEVEIRIKIIPEDDFNADELISDLQWQFAEITGYPIYDIEVEKFLPSPPNERKEQ